MVMESIHSEVILVSKFVGEVFPAVNKELLRWKEQARYAKQEVLANQAFSSIQLKKFHAQGGCVYALYPGSDKENLISFIVAYQTISDYLDNLCDRAAIENEKAFRQLHLAMEDALSPGTCPADYYCYYPYKEDGGYLKKLVLECQTQLSDLPSLSQVQEKILEWARLYSHLQTYKHLSCHIRENKMKGWIEPYLKVFPELSIWEFGAATGSTLGIFILCALATDPKLSQKDVESVSQAYFPWICGLHILLDYFIDKDEDFETGDLNFVSYYESDVECWKRLTWFIEKSMKAASSLTYPDFHRTVIRGLLAMYLSDPKASNRSIKIMTHKLMKAGGARAKTMHFFCQLLRKTNLL